jgi:mRNA interferase MazF
MTQASDIKRGEVWLVNLNPSVGDEIRKTRPCVVVTVDGLGRLRLKTIVPITAPAKTQSHWHVPIGANPTNGLSKDSVADAYQVRSLSFERFHKKLGRLSATQMEDIGASIQIVLGLK